jgi:hypothetical protein
VQRYNKYLGYANKKRKKFGEVAPKSRQQRGSGRLDRPGIDETFEGRIESAGKERTLRAITRSRKRTKKKLEQKNKPREETCSLLCAKKEQVHEKGNK